MPMSNDSPQKIKILFVDDEAYLLRGLQRLLRPLSQEWEISLAGSGAEALERMAQTSFDVIVTDMQMPEMNGVDLLDEVVKRYPKTIRFLLASHSDMEAIYKSVGLMHQFLLKPCDEKSLKAAVLGALKRENTSVGKSLRVLLPKIHQLPSMPTLYLELMELIGDPKVSIDDIGAVITRDITMTAMVLRLVNSAYFGLRYRVSNVTDAAKYLGMEPLRSLVLSLNVFSQFATLNIAGFSAETLWAHSMETAVAAKTIALMEGAGQKMADEAFVAGILHDVGKLVFSVNFKESYQEVVQNAAVENSSFHQMEQAIFGATHADLGGHILSFWGLPTPIVEAIAFHHSPLSSGQMIFGPLTVVHTADAILDQRERKKAHLEAILDMAYLDELGLTDRIGVWRDALKKNNTNDIYKGVGLFRKASAA
jgi:HD-like signal output (HDOD) protein/CheY-like chemotaxis protein